MNQIAFRLPESEKEFLEWYAKKTAQPASSIYKANTLSAFQEWRQKTLLKEYQSGSISFKSFCRLNSISIYQGILLLERNQIEPPISSLMDDFTSTSRKSIDPMQIFKGRKIPKR